MDSLRKSIQTNPRNKKFLNSNLKHSWKPLQHTRISGRQNRQ
jgi:hypothetical protein